MKTAAVLLTALAASASALAIRSNIMPFKLLPVNAPLSIVNAGYLQSGDDGTIGVFPAEGNEFVGITQKGQKEGQVYDYSEGTKDLYILAETGDLMYGPYAGLPQNSSVLFDDFTIQEINAESGEYLGYGGEAEYMWSVCEKDGGAFQLRYGGEPCSDLFHLAVEYVQE